MVFCFPNPVDTFHSNLINFFKALITVFLPGSHFIILFSFWSYSSLPASFYLSVRPEFFIQLTHSYDIRIYIWWWLLNVIFHTELSLELQTIISNCVCNISVDMDILQTSQTQYVLHVQNKFCCPFPKDRYCRYGYYVNHLLNLILSRLAKIVNMHV